MKPLILSLFTSILSATAAFGGAPPVKPGFWICRDTVRVLRDEPVGNAKDVAFAAARNEWESFQILLRSQSPVKGVSVEPGDRRGPGGSVIRAADALLSRQHQHELTRPTCRNDHFKLGWYPDALIPFRHPLTRQPLDGAQLKAVPFDLPANETHGFWDAAAYARACTKLAAMIVEAKRR